MSKSKRIRASDAELLLRAVAEAYEAAADPSQRLSQLVTSGCRIIGARMGSACWATPPASGAKLQLFGYFEGGDWTDHDRRMLHEYYARGDHEEDLMAARIAADWKSLGVHAAVLRQQLLSDQEWYGSDHVNEFRRATDIDSCIYSGLLGRSGVEFFGMTFHRCWGEQPLGERERLLIDILQRGAAPLFFALATAKSGSDLIAALPPRLRQVLAALAQGDSEKQVARRLGLSKQTVHSHVKRLYKQLGVGSRGELFALLASSGLAEAAAKLDSERPRSIRRTRTSSPDPSP